MNGNSCNNDSQQTFENTLNKEIGSNYENFISVKILFGDKYKPLFTEIIKNTELGEKKLRRTFEISFEYMKKKWTYECILNFIITEEITEENTGKSDNSKTQKLIQINIEEFNNN